MAPILVVNVNTWKESCAAHALIGMPTILKHRIPGISDDGQHRESDTSGIGYNWKLLENRWWPSTEIDGRPMNSNHSRRCHDDKFPIGLWLKAYQTSRLKYFFVNKKRLKKRQFESLVRNFYSQKNITNDSNSIYMLLNNL